MVSGGTILQRQRICAPIYLQMIISFCVVLKMYYLVEKSFKGQYNGTRCAYRGYAVGQKGCTRDSVYIDYLVKLTPYLGKHWKLVLMGQIIYSCVEKCIVMEKSSKGQYNGAKNAYKAMRWAREEAPVTVSIQITL
jgi:hypothetical protein